LKAGIEGALATALSRHVRLTPRSKSALIAARLGPAGACLRKTTLAAPTHALPAARRTGS
jgi:hypothetical protein